MSNEIESIKNPSRPKIKKYNPKPGRVCVGEFLRHLFAQYQYVFNAKELTDAEKAMGAWIMNMTMLDVTQRWCKCPWCMHEAGRIEEFLSKDRKDQKEEDVKVDNVQQKE